MPGVAIRIPVSSIVKEKSNTFLKAKSQNNGSPKAARMVCRPLLVVGTASDGGRGHRGHLRRCVFGLVLIIPIFRVVIINNEVKVGLVVGAVVVVSFCLPPVTTESPQCSSSQTFLCVEFLQ